MIRVRHPRAFLWLLLAAALFMRAFLPQGYMAERTESGAITVRVCGSGHLLQIRLGPDEAPARAERAEPPCAFAGLGAPALPPPAIAELPTKSIERAFAPLGEPVPPLATLLRHPPARGPPPAA